MGGHSLPSAETSTFAETLPGTPWSRYLCGLLKSVTSPLTFPASASFSWSTISALGSYLASSFAPFGYMPRNPSPIDCFAIAVISAGSEAATGTIPNRNFSLRHGSQKSRSPDVFIHFVTSMSCTLTVKLTSPRLAHCSAVCNLFAARFSHTDSAFSISGR